jgi:D-sedoheptulose 7-phosphate isomerase
MSEDLQRVYPFLASRPRDPGKVEQELLEAIAAKARAAREANDRFFALAGPRLVSAASAIAQAYRNGGRLLTMGNGGSSCDAAHIAVDFVHPATAGRPALAAVNLVADVAALSAFGDDLGFEQVFVRQLAAHGRGGDALLGISTTGRSRNLIAAFAKARQLGITTIALIGYDGGALAEVVDHCLCVPATSSQRVQECHVVACHVLWDLVHTLLAGDPDAGPAPQPSTRTTPANF